jgi:hypothetical protein
MDRSRILTGVVALEGFGYLIMNGAFLFAAAQQEAETDAFETKGARRLHRPFSRKCI